MEFRRREALRMSRIFLLENVVFDVLVDHIIDQDIFTDGMLDYIRAGGDTTEKIRRMLDYLCRRPDSCFQKFLNALVNSGHDHCALHIQEKYVRSGPTQVHNPSDDNYTPLYQTSVPQASQVVPMETSSSGLPEKYSYSLSFSYPGKENSVPASSNEQFGFPETTSSMHAHAGSFTSIPVQETSSPGGQVPLNNAGNGYPSQVTGLGVEGMSVGSSEVGSVNSHSSGDSYQQTVYDRHVLSDRSRVYTMESNPRGLALIINNETFQSMKTREGSKRDMENLHKLFKHLGFDVCHQRDKTALEMQNLLKSFAQYGDLQRVDSLVVVILSHGGGDGVIYGTDGNSRNREPHKVVRDKNIMDIFSAKNCPFMAQKPKLFIIQACRGRHEDRPDSRMLWQQDDTHTDSGSGQVISDGSSVASNTSTTASQRTANMADMCLIHSTVQGYVSYRHPVDGSPFITEFVNVIDQMSTHEHLTDMMVEVNKRMSNLELKNDVRTIPSTTNTLTKKWFLNPLHIYT